MGSSIDTTVASVLIPEILRPGFIKALYQASVAKARILSCDGDVARMGDILDIVLAPVGSVSDVTTTTGAITEQTLQASQKQLTIDKWKDYSYTIIDQAAAQARSDLNTVLSEGAPKAFAKQIDDDIFALQSALTTHTAIDATGGLIADNLTTAFYNLANSAVEVDNPNNMSWFFSWKQWPVLKKISQLNDAQITGEANGGMLKFRLPDIFGVPVYFSSVIENTGGEHKNLLVHRNALACGVQKNFRMEMLARTKKATTYSADMMYGVKEVDIAQGQVIRTLS